MISRTTRILFLGALLAVAAFVLLELPARRESARRQRAGARLVSCDPARVDGVRVRRPDDELSFVLRDGGWEMLAPLSDHAEPSAVATLIDALCTAGVGRNLGPAGEEPRFGLRPPAATVWLAAGRDTVARVELGDYTVDRSFVYARRDDGDIVLAPTDIRRAATLAVDEYRNRRVVSIDRAGVRAFALRTRTGSSTWTRAGNTAWFTVVAGDTIEGDSTAVEGVLRTLRGLRAARFLPAADTARALEHPDVSVTLELPPPAPAITVRFRCPPDAACLARCDHETRVSEVASDLSALTAAALDNLRDRRLLRFPPERAVRVEVSTPDTSLVLVRAGQSWALPNPALGPLDPAAATAFVRMLRSMRWSRIAASGTAHRSRSAREFNLAVYASDGAVLDEVHGFVRGTPAVLVGTSRSSRLTTETDASTLDALTAALRRLKP